MERTELKDLGQRGGCYRYEAQGGRLGVERTALKDSGQRNRFYRLRRVILSGVPEHPNTDRVHIVEIGMRTERERLIELNRHIKRKLAKLGLKSEHCYCASVEQIDGYSKLEGLIRLDRYMNSLKLEPILREVWTQNRKRKRDVEVRVFGWVDIELRQYIRENVLGYVAEGEYRMKHLVKSEGWVLAKGAVSGDDWYHKVVKSGV